MLMKHLQKTPCNVQIKTLATCLEKNYLLQHQTEATATVETKSAMQGATSEKN